MTAQLALSLDPKHFHFGADETLRPANGPVRKNDAQMDIREVEALRQVDLIAPPEVAEVAEPLVRLYAGEMTSGDHLRLSQRTSHDGPSLMAAVGRILSVSTAEGGGSRDDVIKEERMRRVLGALQFATHEIRRNANVAPARR